MLVSPVLAFDYEQEYVERHDSLPVRLYLAAEERTRMKGCHEMAPDADLDNKDSQATHQRLGYTVTGWLVHYCKLLN